MPWTEQAVEELPWCLLNGGTIKEIAEILSRPEAEIRARITELDPKDKSSWMDRL